MNEDAMYEKQKRRRTIACHSMARLPLARARRRRRGMTLVEIMIVIIIMAVIATGVAVAVLPQRTQALIRQARTDGMTMQSAAVLYLANDPGADCPSVDDLVEAGMLNRSARTTDPWDNPFTIECDGDDVVVGSNGPDGNPGTEDDIRPQ
jgi:general secretion pathway protein G